MANRPTFRGLGDLGAMTDEQLRTDVLGNWHKLNGAIVAGGASEGDIVRLLALELSRGRDARANFLDKLRGALWAKRSRRSRESLRSVARAIVEGRVPDRADLVSAGLTDEFAEGVRRSLTVSAYLEG